jgi:hypothetical protein
MYFFLSVSFVFTFIPDIMYILICIFIKYHVLCIFLPSSLISVFFLLIPFLFLLMLLIYWSIYISLVKFLLSFSETSSVTWMQSSVSLFSMMSYQISVRFQASMAASMGVTFFRNVAQCSLVEVYRRIRGSCYLHYYHARWSSQPSPLKRR